MNFTWEKLLCPERPVSEEPGYGKDLRTEYERDYQRIITSPSFRRLADKTQVFPLDKSDFIRTRLTHSLEAASIGRSLAENISEEIIKKGIDPQFTADTESRLASVIESAGLVHDIGNPPFGHFGEETIRFWFREHLRTLNYKNKPVKDFLTPQQQYDLLNFDGNAQGIRVLTKLHFSENGHGLNVTYALLSAMLKYPTPSNSMKPDSDNVRERKLGFFASEARLFNDIQKNTGTRGARNPLAFILEAADDIAYSTADIEDAFRKGFIDYGTLLEELKKRGVGGRHTERLKERFESTRQRAASGDGEYAVQAWMADVRDYFISEASGAFVEGYGELMDGVLMKELLASRAEAWTLLKALKSIAYDYAFTSMEIYKTEIAANRILTYLLNWITGAALRYDSTEAPRILDEKFMSLFSKNYLEAYRSAARGLKEEDKVYYKLLLATDTISGMTDGYARDLYTDLNGITF